MASSSTRTTELQKAAEQEEQEQPETKEFWLDRCLPKREPLVKDPVRIYRMLYVKQTSAEFHFAEALT